MAGVIDQYVASLRRELDFDPALAGRLASEVEDHLRDAAEADPAWPSPDAERRAVERFGVAREIAAQFAADAVDRQARRTWITLQAVRTADIHRDDDLGAALANSVRRLIRRLARDELPTRTLDREEALSLIVGLAQLGDPADGPDPVQVRETWGAWNAGLTTQACFRIDKWQEAEESARQLILHRLQMVPSLGTTVAIAARRRDRRAELQSHVVIRITEANRARLNNSADLLEFAMANTGSNVRLERLNGDQLAAVAA